MPVLITLNLHPGKKEFTVNFNCHAIASILADVSSYKIHDRHDDFDYVHYGWVQLYSVVAHTKSWNLLTEVHLRARKLLQNIIKRILQRSPFKSLAMLVVVAN